MTLHDVKKGGENAKPEVKG